MFRYVQELDIQGAAGNGECSKFRPCSECSKCRASPVFFLLDIRDGSVVLRRIIAGQLCQLCLLQRSEDHGQSLLPIRSGS